MARNEPDFEMDDERFVAFIEAAIQAVLEHQQPEPFLEWMRVHAAEEFADLYPIDDPEMLPRLMTHLGRAIWNVTPLPSNDFRPRPLPKTGRNDPCHCGSGRKFKQCCQALESFPLELDAETMMDSVLGLLSEEEVERLVAQRRLSPEQLGEIAARAMDDEEPERARALLEPLFEGDLRRLNHRLALPLEVLVNAYEDLDRDDAKEALLQRAIQEGGAALCSEAWQRIARDRNEAGDSEGAWTAFRHAQRAAPDAPNLALVEIDLLGTEGRFEEVRERARFALARQRRQGVEGGPLTEFLEAVVQDPEGAFAPEDDFEVDEEASPFDDLPQEMRDALAAALSDAEGREPPVYTLEGVVVDPVALGRELAERLRAMGIEAPEPDAAEAGEPFEGLCLRGPEGLTAIEAAWRQVFPINKPFGVSPTQEELEAAWLPEAAAVWIGFLTEHPQALDSLECLDDLACVLGPIGISDPELQEDLYWACLNRAGDIIWAAEQGFEPDVLLPSIIPANRTLLRILWLRAAGFRDDEEWDLAIDEDELALRLEPGDPLGSRDGLSEAYLRMEDYDAVVELAEDWLEDRMPSLHYDAALAHFQARRPREADAALARAIACSPAVARGLLGVGGMPEGLGDELNAEAMEEWLAERYCGERADLWDNSPGAIAWLKRTVEGAPGPRPARGRRRRR